MDGYIGEIRAFAFNFVPQGWYICNGQELSIYQSQALYAVIGNTWGGTATKTFCLPNLQGFTVMGQGAGPGLTPRIWGNKTVGEATLALSYQQLPPHSHTLTFENPVATNANVNTLPVPVANSSWLARVTQPISATTANPVFAYTKNTGQAPDASLHGATIGVGGGNLNGVADPHENRQPYLVMLYCICSDGVFPIRN